MENNTQLCLKFIYDNASDIDLKLPVDDGVTFKINTDFKNTSVVPGSEQDVDMILDFGVDKVDMALSQAFYSFWDKTAHEIPKSVQILLDNGERIDTMFDSEFLGLDIQDFFFKNGMHLGDKVSTYTTKLYVYLVYKK